MKLTLLCFFFLLSVIFAQECTNVTYTEGNLNCSTIEGYLMINHSLSDNVDGLNNVTTVNGLLYVHKSNSLINLNGLSNLKFADSIIINENDALVSVVLSSLENTNHIRIVHNKNLTAVNLPKLKAVNGSITIISMFNPANESSTYIKELKMESLTEVAKYFEIENSLFPMNNAPLLMDINLNSLSYVGGKLSIETTGPKNFDNWKLSKIGGHFNVQNVQGLTSISIDTLTSVNGSITWMYNNDLNVVKLQNLNYVSGVLYYKSNSTFCLLPTMFGANLTNCTLLFTTCNDSHFDTCRTCNEQYWGSACANKCNCSSPQLCSNGINGNGVCVCPTGKAGSLCENCDKGYFGVNCTACPVCTDGTVCLDGKNGTGLCDTPTSCKDNEMKIVNRCIDKLYVGLGIGGASLLVIIIVVIIVVAAKRKDNYQKLE